MNETCRFAVSLSCAIACLTASAGNPFHRLLECQPVPDCIGRWCPDDYCSKKEPYVCVPLRFECDDYCSKKEPCVCVPLRFQCDDYCSKKEPCVRPGLRFTCDDYCKKCIPKVRSSPRCDLLGCGSRCCTSGRAVASHEEAAEEKRVNVAELPEEWQTLYESAEETVANDEEFVKEWHAVTVALPGSAASE